MSRWCVSLLPSPRPELEAHISDPPTAPSQEAIFAFLSDPATHGGAPVKRIDTHAASVFLAGERALKVKQAVRFPFLDYSTLDKRKAACEAELEVNRPFAPELYRRVVPITRAADGTLALGGDGTPVEWAVEMRRFDETATLDHLADAGKLDATLADALGRAVAAAHALAPPVAAEPWIDGTGELCRAERCGLPRRARTVRSRPPRRRSPRRAARRSRACVRCCANAAGSDSSAAATAIFTSATSC